LKNKSKAKAIKLKQFVTTQFLKVYNKIAAIMFLLPHRSTTPFCYSPALSPKPKRAKTYTKTTTTARMSKTNKNLNDVALTSAHTNTSK